MVRISEETCLLDLGRVDRALAPHDERQQGFRPQRVVGDGIVEVHGEDRQRVRDLDILGVAVVAPLEVRFATDHCGGSNARMR